MCVCVCVCVCIVSQKSELQFHTKFFFCIFVSQKTEIQFESRVLKTGSGLYEIDGGKSFRQFSNFERAHQ